MSGGGRFDFDDGGTYCGGWEDGKAHGHGVCTGPKGQGEYSGAWQHGFEVNGVYTWPSGNTYEGQWTQGKRNGLGTEAKGHWTYRGEWTQGFKGRYGVRQSSVSGAKYEGTWTTGLQDGYGVETYADGGSYQGQWLRGMRHGYGARQSVPYGLASHYRPKGLNDSLTSLRSTAEDENVVKDRDRKVDDSRGGFVLQARSSDSPTLTPKKKTIFDKPRTSLRKTLIGLKLRKQKSTGDIADSPNRRTATGSMRSTISSLSNASQDSTQSALTSASMYTESNHSFVSQDDISDANVTEKYMGEWKNDKRAGFGVSERTDGLKYEGEWYNNKKYGYGVTTFKDGTKEEGKYKNNVLISSGKKGKIFVIRSSKMRERVDNAVGAARRAAEIAAQKADIAISRMANARDRAEKADQAALRARQDSDMARIKAKEVAPEFHQPGTDILRKKLEEGGIITPELRAQNIPNHNPYIRATSMHETPGGHAGLDSKTPNGAPSSFNTLPPSTLDHGGHVSKLEIERLQAPSLKRLNRELPAGRFSDLLDSTVVSDHFGQYGRGSFIEKDRPSSPTKPVLESPQKEIMDVPVQQVTVQSVSTIPRNSQSKESLTKLSREASGSSLSKSALDRNSLPRDVKNPRDDMDVRNPRDKLDTYDRRDPWDVRDPRDIRDPRDLRDLHDTRDPRDPRYPRDPRDPMRDTLDPRDTRYPRDPRDPRGTLDPRDMRDPRDTRDFRDPRYLDSRDIDRYPRDLHLMDPRDTRDPRDPYYRDYRNPRDRREYYDDPRDPYRRDYRDPYQREFLPRDDRRDAYLRRDLSLDSSLLRQNSLDSELQRDTRMDIHSRPDRLADMPLGSTLPRDTYSRDTLPRDRSDYPAHELRDHSPTSSMPPLGPLPNDLDRRPDSKDRVYSRENRPPDTPTFTISTDTDSLGGSLRHNDSVEFTKEDYGAPLVRRKSLPSIVKQPTDVKNKAKEKSKTTFRKDSGVPHKGPEADTIVIENGIRKRVQSLVAEVPPTAKPSPVKAPTDLPKRYTLEEQNKSKRGSLPDVNAWSEVEKNLMPREEVSKLSHQRRAELIKMQKEAERRKNQEIVLRLTDFKEWCQERQLLMFVIAVNVSLATMFINLVNQ